MLKRLVNTTLYSQK